MAWRKGKHAGQWGSTWASIVPASARAVIANFADEPTTFLRLDDPKRLAFADAAVAEGLAGRAGRWLKFGVFFFDYDLDGRLDLLTANGHLEPEIADVQPGQTYEQPAAAVLEHRRQRTALRAGSGRGSRRPTCSSRSSAAAAPSPTSTATATSMWC